MPGEVRWGGWGGLVTFSMKFTGSATKLFCCDNVGCFAAIKGSN